MDPKKGSIRKTKKRSRSNEKVIWTFAQSRKLAEYVEVNTCLWLLADPSYKKPDAHSAAWEFISSSLGFSVDECKNKWKSLRDAFRYRKGRRKAGKSSDSAAEDEDELYDHGEQLLQLTNREMCNCMKFLLKDQPQRTTSSSFQMNASSVSQSEENSESTEPIIKKTCETGTAPTSIYDFANKKKKVDKTDQLLEGIAGLIKLRHSESQMPGSDVNNLKFMSVYTNLDRMLQKLPESKVEDLNFQFVQLAYEAVKSHENALTSDN